MKFKTVIFGSGGHARVVLDAISLCNYIEPQCILTNAHVEWGQAIMDIPILGNDALIPEIKKDLEVTHFIIGVGSVGNTDVRSRLYNYCKQYFEPVNLIHPKATVSHYAQLGTGIQALANCVINAGSVVGNNVIINTGAIVEHDCIIGDHAHISPGAVLGGNVKVGSAAHVGIGSVVKERIVIGEGALLGAGAVAIRDIESHTIAIGVPAHKNVTSIVKR